METTSKEKPGITAVILTCNEEIHIGRVLDNVSRVASRIVVVDSGSTDRTREIAAAQGAEVVEYEWPGNQALQFNRAMEALEITTPWVLRLDADEYLTDELIAELCEKLPALPEDVTAVSLPRGRCFRGKLLKHGIVNSVNIIRLFRPGCAVYEPRLMDEHLSVVKGRTVEMKCKFIDDNQQPMSAFIAKHNGYALREAALMLDAEFDLNLPGCGAENDASGALGGKVAAKRRQKSRYARLPVFWRAAAYFFYRHFLRLGFLDGKAGFEWDFFQGWWYRTLVDSNIREIKREAGGNPSRIREILVSRLNLKG